MGGTAGSIIVDPRIDEEPIGAIRADDASAMERVAKLFWVNELQRAAGEGAAFEGITISGVDRLVVVTSNYPEHAAGREITREQWRAEVWRVEILEMSVGGVLRGRDLYEATWAAYVLSLKATVDAGTNERAHVGDGTCVPIAQAFVERLGATARPHRSVYASGGTYLERALFDYDDEPRTLYVTPLICS